MPFITEIEADGEFNTALAASDVGVAGRP